MSEILERAKTEALPYLRLIRGKYWYFKHKEALIPMGEEYGTDRFYERWSELLVLYHLDAPDERTVYFVGWEDGPVKIGVAGEIGARLQVLQMACPYSLKVWATADGGLPKEREYHKLFANCRLRGEWFERTPELLAEIERLNSKPTLQP